MSFLLSLVKFLEKWTKREFWAIVGVLCSGEETPCSGEGPSIGEESPCRCEAEREGWPDLEFATAKLLFTA